MRRKAAEHGARQHEGKDHRQVSGKMIGIDEGPRRTPCCRIRCAPIQRHHRPENLAVPQRPSDQPDQGDDEAGNKHSDHYDAGEFQAGPSAAPVSCRIERDCEQQRCEGKRADQAGGRQRPRYSQRPPSGRVNHRHRDGRYRPFRFARRPTRRRGIRGRELCLRGRRALDARRS